MVEVNGHKYSSKEFDGYKFRAIVHFEFLDGRDIGSMQFYTTDPNKEALLDVLRSKLEEGVDINDMSIYHWTTKEQDILDANFIEEWLKS